MIRKGSVTTTQIGTYGQQGYRKSVPVKVIDIEAIKGKPGQSYYWFRVLGLGILGKAQKHKPDNKTALFCAVNNAVGVNGLSPRVKDINTESEALVYLGYGMPQ